MLTMNYNGLYEKYSRPKKKKKQLSNTKTKDFDYWNYIESQTLKITKTNRCKGKNKKQSREHKKSLKEVYQDQLNNERWKKKRLMILKKYHFKCALCGNTQNLCVHHTKYITNKKAWEYQNTTLVCLCKDCHEKVHKDKNHDLYPKFY